MKKPRAPSESFTSALERILKIEETLTIEEILSTLASHGLATLLLIFSLPLCFPIQIPGLSTPFGIILALIGLRIGFTKRLWIPHWILQKKIPKETLGKIIKKILSVSHFLQKFLHPRLTTFVKNKTFIRVSGTLIIILSLFLSMPLPIPMTNLLSTLPIIALGLGFLEDDGLCILLGYFLSIVCFIFFFYIFYFGASTITKLLERW